MQTDHSAWLHQTLIKLELVDEKAYQKSVSEFLDEQAFMMGFLFNLEEDFSETVHDLLIRATLALHKSLSETGLFFKLITSDMLDEIISRKLAEYDEIEKDVEVFDTAPYFEAASSPVALKGLYEFIDQNTTEDELHDEERSNLLLVLSAIIELFENAAAPENPENAMKTDA